MTRTAREVLYFCKIAAKELTETEFKNNEIWRLRWVTMMSLLRAVHPVLLEKDIANYGLDNREKIKSIWLKKKSDYIFKEFINKVRNLLLKEFDFKHITPKEFNLVTSDGFMIVTESNSHIIIEKIYFKDCEEKTVYELIDEALSWWENILNEIDMIL